MENLFEKEGHSIFTFKPGDIIIQLKSAEMKKPYHNENLGITVDIVTSLDNSFREKPVEFIGIENNLIYLKNIAKVHLGLGKITSVLIETYSEDWALFVPPKGLTLDDCL